MFKRNLLGALALCLFGIGSIALTQDRDLADRDAARIETLVQQLGSAKFTDREKAKKELEGIGTPALTALKKAAKDDNLETSKRAEELVRKIEERMLTADMLNPKRVHLNVKDQPVLEVVAELSRLSGYNLQVVGDRAALADKKITIDTGNVTFFEALDQVCAKAGLNDQIVNGTVFPGAPRPPIFRRGGLKIRAVPAVPVLPRVVPGKIAPAPAPAPDLPAPPPAPRNLRPENGALLQVADEPADEVKPVQPKVAPKVGKIIGVKGVVVGPVQFQIQPGFPGGAPGFGGVVPSTGGPTVQLTPGVHKSIPTSYAGSVRMRALSGKNLPTTTPKTTDTTIILDALGEPRLQGFHLVGTPTILKAVDELGQELIVSNEVPKVAPAPGARDDVMILPVFPGGATAAPGAAGRQQTVVFKKGEKSGKMIKELKGTVTAQATIPNEAIVKMDNVLTAAGKSAKGAAGGSMNLDSIDKQADGSYRVKVRMENLQPNPFGAARGGIVINGGAVQVIQIGPGGAFIGGRNTAQRGMPDLVDARGNKYQVVGVPGMRTQINGGVVTQEATLLFRAPAGAGEPASLVLFGERPVNFQIPFTFRDVPLE